MESKALLPVSTGYLFSTPVRSDFGDYLTEIYAFWLRHPAIQASVAADLAEGALADKRLRAADRAFTAAQTAPLFTKTGVVSTPSPGAELLAGRPRTPDLVVFIAALATGFSGSLYAAPARTLMLESMSLRSLLDDLGYSLPAPNTLGPLIDRLSGNTLTLIHRAQLADFLDEGLDSFQELTVDSTSIHASSCWPTDSNVIYRLFERTCRLGAKLACFGLTPLNVTCKDIWLNELKNSARAIALLGNGAGRARCLRRHYDTFYQTACKLGAKLLDGVHAILLDADKELLKIKPSRRQQADSLLTCIQDDVFSAIKTIQQSMIRVHDGITTKSRDKVLSLADRSAAYIEKGGREPVIGYKPQLARSGEGFVTALILNEGNGADSRHLTPLVQHSILNTGVVPLSTSTDDGYASAAGLGEVQEMGVQQVSISGAKGRALLGETLWDDPNYVTLRSDRSAIESLMFTLKFNHNFGHPGRRGVAAVRCELTLKILAYNFDHALRIRERKAQAARMPKAA